MANNVLTPFATFNDVDGNPLEYGYIYIGEENQNPEAVPVSVFWDEALTIPAAQPIRTIGGYPSRSGSPGRIFVAAAYSITIRNKNGTLIYTLPSDNILGIEVNILGIEVADGRKLWQNQATTITPSSDADYTLTAGENKYGRLVLVDGSWTTDHNLIIDNTERSLLVDASGLTLNTTVKTSAGTGIPVFAGTKVWLLCDGTNVLSATTAFLTQYQNYSGDMDDLKTQGNWGINTSATNKPASGYFSVLIYGEGSVLTQLATNRADGKTYARAWNGTIWTAWAELGAVGGKLLQAVNFTTGAYAAGTTIMPLDNTIPQITEGTQFMSLAITPKSATSKLKITVAYAVSVTAPTHIIGALFRDSTANAIASAATPLGTADTLTNNSFVKVVDSVSISPTTFTFRAGPQVAATVGFNGRIGAQQLGGSIASSITIEEIEV